MKAVLMYDRTLAESGRTYHVFTVAMVSEEFWEPLTAMFVDLGDNEPEFRRVCEYLPETLPSGSGVYDRNTGETWNAPDDLTLMMAHDTNPFVKWDFYLNPSSVPLDLWVGGCAYLIEAVYLEANEEEIHINTPLPQGFMPPTGEPQILVPVDWGGGCGGVPVQPGFSLMWKVVAFYWRLAPEPPYKRAFLWANMAWAYGACTAAYYAQDAFLDHTDTFSSHIMGGHAPDAVIETVSSEGAVLLRYDLPDDRLADTLYVQHCLANQQNTGWYELFFKQDNYSLEFYRLDIRLPFLDSPINYYPPDMLRDPPPRTNHPVVMPIVGVNFLLQQQHGKGRMQGRLDIVRKKFPKLTAGRGLIHRWFLTEPTYTSGLFAPAVGNVDAVATSAVIPFADGLPVFAEDASVDFPVELPVNFIVDCMVRVEDWPVVPEKEWDSLIAFPSYSTYFDVCVAVCLSQFLCDRHGVSMREVCVMTGGKYSGPGSNILGSGIIAPVDASFKVSVSVKNSILRVGSLRFSLLGPLEPFGFTACRQTRPEEYPHFMKGSVHHVSLYSKEN